MGVGGCVGGCIVTGHLKLNAVKWVFLQLATPITAINNHNSNSKRTGNIIHAKNKFESDDNNNNNIGHRSIALIT